MVDGIADTIKSKIKSALGISSPSKVMEQFGIYIAQGLADGIGKGEDKVKEQMDRMAQVIQGASQTMLANVDRYISTATAKFNLARSRFGNSSTESTRIKYYNPGTPDYLTAFRQENQQLNLNLLELQHSPS